MAKFRKKPVVIEAVRWDGDLSNVIRELGQPGQRIFRVEGDCLFIVTIEGTMKADNGDMIIKGVQGECYPCKPDIFEATYEKAEDK